MTTTKTIYVGSLWHEFCDPFVTVAGYDEDTVQAKLDELAEDEWQVLLEHGAEAGVPEDEVGDTIRTGGIFPEASLDDFLLEEKERRLAELAEDGIVVF